MRFGACLMFIGWVMVSSPTSALASGRGETYLTLYGGVDFPMSPSDFTDVYDTGYDLGVTLRHHLRGSTSLVAEVEFNKFAPDLGSALPAPFLVAPGTSDHDGGVIARMRYSAGLALGTKRADRVQAHFKLLAGWYRTSFEDLRFKVIEPGGGIREGVLEVESENDFGLNFGAGIDIPVAPSVFIYVGVDSDLVLGGDETFSGDISDLAIKGGLTFNF